MKLALILGLALIGLLEIPLFSYVLRTKQIATEGKIKGEQVEIKVTSLPSPPSLLPPPPPSLLPQIKPLVNPSPIPSPPPSPQTIREIVLLHRERELKDEKIEIIFPKLDKSRDWYLDLEIELVSIEDALGFDSPGFGIYLDNHLVYQLSAFEDETKKISFNLATFSRKPELLSIWSGNGGDELKDTYVVIKKIKLIPQNNHYSIETEAVNDLVVTNNDGKHLTLDWGSPKTNDVNLNKVLAYDIRYSDKEITQENWAQSQPVKIILPQDLPSHSPGSQEIMLIESPPINSGFISIRSLDSTGSLSPLGKSALFSS